MCDTCGITASQVSLGTMKHERGGESSSLGETAGAVVWYWFLVVAAGCT